MSTRERRERRAERLKEWAEKREGRQAALDKAADPREEATGIPLGQPILVGHHSEGRHRRAIERLDRAMGTSVENARTAAAMRSRAENIEAANEAAIYDDDEDAVERLTARIAELEHKRDEIKRINKAARAGTLTDAEREMLGEANRYAPVAGTHGGFPSYHLTNLSGNINRLKKRLANLSRPETGRWLDTRYPGECRTCEREIAVGERVMYFRRTKTVECEACATPPIAA